MTKVTFVNFFIKTYSILPIQYMYKISCKIDKNCLRYSLFFHHGPTSPPSLRFSKKPSPGRVKRFLNWNKVFVFFLKKVNTGKGQNSVLCNRFILYSPFSVLTLAFDMAVLYGNDAFSILVLSNKKRYFSSLKKVFIFQKIFFKIKSIEIVQNVHWLSRKNMPISQTEGYLKNPYYRILWESMLFLLALK